MQIELFKILEEKGEEVPTVPRANLPPAFEKKFKEEVDLEKRRIEEIKRDYAEKEKVMQEDYENRMAQREARANELMEADYARREKGKSGSIIPAAISPTTD